MSTDENAQAARATLRKIIQGEAASAGVLDLRELEAPLPLERALAHASTLLPTQHCIVWTPRVPQMLLARLRERGFRFVVEVAPDDSALVYVERP